MGNHFSPYTVSTKGSATRHRPVMLGKDTKLITLWTLMNKSAASRFVVLEPRKDRSERVGECTIDDHRGQHEAVGAGIKSQRVPGPKNFPIRRLSRLRLT